MTTPDHGAGPVSGDIPVTPTPTASDSTGITPTATNTVGRRRAPKGKTDKPDKKKLQVHPDAAPPTMGWPVWVLRYRLKMRKEDPSNPGYVLVPPPNKREQDMRDAAALEEQARRDAEALEEQLRQAQQDFEERVDYFIVRLRYLAALGIQPIMSFCNIKSASKTTVSLYVGSLIAELTRKTVILLPATQNTATSTAALNAGIDSGNLITVSELSRKIADHGVYRALSGRVPRTKFGLGVISEDPNNATDVNDVYAVEEFRELVLTILPNVDVLILDHGNDNIQADSIVLEAARLSHVLVFPYIADMAQLITSEMLNRTYNGYMTDTTTPVMDERFSQTGRRIPTQEKVSNSILVASKAGSEPIDFDMLTRPMQQGGDVPQTPPWRGEGFSVPSDAHISSVSPGSKVSVCDIDAIDGHTRLAYLEIAVAVFETTARMTGVAITPNRYHDTADSAS